MEVATLKDYLGQPIDGTPLQLFRFLFGTLLFFNLLKERKGLHLYYTSFDFYFKFPFFEFVKPLGKWGMHIVLYTLLAAYLFFAIGIFYPAASLIALFLRTYLFLIDKATYNHHYYLIILLLFLFAVIGSPKPVIPYWHLLIFQLQLLIVYTWAGINKIQYDWLVRGEPMRQTFVETIPNASMGYLFHLPYTGLVFSWFGILFDLTIIWLLMNPITFPYALPFYILFHLFNWRLFEIGIFPLLNLVAIVLFINGGLH